MTVINKSMLQIKSGREKIGVNFTGLGEMKQNEEGLIFFNKKDPVYFELLDYVFDGPIYNIIVDSKQTGKSVTSGKNKSNKKGKSGKVVGGAILGTMLLPGLGTAVGAYAGGKGKDKKKGKDRSITKDNSQSIETQRQVEIPGTATLKFKNVESLEVFSIQIVCDSSKNAQLINFKISEDKSPTLINSSKSVVEQIKEYKELLDMEIINQEEFNKKKNELLNL